MNRRYGKTTAVIKLWALLTAAELFLNKWFFLLWQIAVCTFLRSDYVIVSTIRV